MRSRADARVALRTEEAGGRRKVSGTDLTGGGAPLSVLLQLLVALLGSIVALLGPLVALFDEVEVELQRRCVVPVGKRLPDLVFQPLLLLVSVLQLSACLVPVTPRLLNVGERFVPRRLAACHRDLGAAECCPSCRSGVTGGSSDAMQHHRVMQEHRLARGNIRRGAIGLEARGSSKWIASHGYCEG